MEIYVLVILFFLICSIVILHCDIFNFREKLSNKYLIALNAFIPEDESYSKEQKIIIAKTASFLTAVVILVFLISLIISGIIPHIRGEAENKLFGPIGDLFNGIVTPILTFLTFCGLLITILIQNVQMKATLHELDLTRQEARKSSDALNAQVVNSAAQKFDNNFFSLLNNHEKVVDQIVEGKIVKGGGGVRINVDQYFEIFSCFAAIDTWSGAKDQFLPLFLINYNLLSYIDKHVIGVDKSTEIFDFEEAKTYSNILRAILPNEILYLIYFNVSVGDFPEYKKLLEKYSFFEHLNFTQVDFTVFSKLLINVDINAFGDKYRIKNYIKTKRGLDNFFNAYLNNVYRYIESKSSYTADEKLILMKNANKFVSVNYNVEFINNDISSFFKALLSNNVNELLNLKNFELSDLMNYE